MPAKPASVSVVAEAFRSAWSTDPAAVARAPGRVNLIGEHIDYEGYGVMPMAIEQACFVAVGWQPAGSASRSPQDADVHSMQVANIAPDQYPTAVLPLLPEADTPAAAPAWLNYVHAAYKGCVEFARGKETPVVHQGNILLMVGSSIPPAAGLSSSSALVVAVALALLELWALPASPSEVAEFTCRCERFVGTQGGGMDQAVSLLATAGRAMHVEFAPVRAAAVPLPPGGMFVVANSLAPSAKAETASYRFNLRVLECRLAAMLLAHQLSKAAQGPGSTAAQGLQWQEVSILKQVESHILHHMTSNSSSSSSGCSSADPATVLSQGVQELLPQDSYTLVQVAEMLGVQQQQLIDQLPTGLKAAAAAANELRLQQRASHVFTEAQRVLAFKHVCDDQQLSADDKLQQLGALLNASHTSCSELYQCSCEELDTLVQTARDAGTLGARLTGAGWGGCIIALVRQEHLAAFMQHMRDTFYSPLVRRGVITEQDVPRCLFATSPSAGAHVTSIGRHAAAGSNTTAAVAESSPVLAVTT